jgi:hypothetical protein
MRQRPAKGDVSLTCGELCAIKLVKEYLKK